MSSKSERKEKRGESRKYEVTSEVSAQCLGVAFAIQVVRKRACALRRRSRVHRRGEIIESET